MELCETAWSDHWLSIGYPPMLRLGEETRAGNPIPSFLPGVRRDSPETVLHYGESICGSESIGEMAEARK